MVPIIKYFRANNFSHGFHVEYALKIEELSDK